MITSENQYCNFHAMTPLLRLLSRRWERRILGNDKREVAQGAQDAEEPACRQAIEGACEEEVGIVLDAKT